MFDFGAAWCGPCKMIAPVFDGLAAEFPSIRFFKVDIDNDQLSKTVAENSGQLNAPCGHDGLFAGLLQSTLLISCICRARSCGCANICELRWR
jgi:thiol-disulfide isomerase/thioredoxin